MSVRWLQGLPPPRLRRLRWRHRPSRRRLPRTGARHRPRRIPGKAQSYGRPGCTSVVRSWTPVLHRGSPIPCREHRWTNPSLRRNPDRPDRFPCSSFPRTHTTPSPREEKLWQRERRNERRAWPCSPPRDTKPTMALAPAGGVPRHWGARMWLTRMAARAIARGPMASSGHAPWPLKHLALDP